MEILPLLVQPLLLIAGVALLINSTQTRLCHLEGRLRQAVHDTDTPARALDQLSKNMRRHGHALTSLYGAVALLCLASVAGAVLIASPDAAFPIVIVLTCLGFVAALFAAVTLITASAGGLDAPSRPSGAETLT